MCLDWMRMNARLFGRVRSLTTLQTLEPGIGRFDSRQSENSLPGASHPQAS